MSIIALTTDFGLKDHYVGSLKGKIYSEFPEAKIVDISHDVDPFNISEACYIISAAYDSFPNKTVHIIGVDMELNQANQHVAIEWNNQFFIAADNGILSILTLKIKPTQIFAINIHDRFPTNAADIDVFVKVACHLSRGGTMNVIGKEITALKQITDVQPTISDDGKKLSGIVNYIDHYGNAVTNISKKTFDEHIKGRSFEINFKNKNIKTIFAKYSIGAFEKKNTLASFAGAPVAVFNDVEFLEIAIFKSNPNGVGSANSLLGLKCHDVVTIQFEN